MFRDPLLNEKREIVDILNTDWLSNKVIRLFLSPSQVVIPLKKCSGRGNTERNRVNDVEMSEVRTRI